MEYIALNYFLRTEDIDPDIRSILYHIARAAKYINVSIRSKNTHQEGTHNASGESQMQLDVLADTIITEHLRASGMLRRIASEEQDTSPILSGDRGQYFVAFDPLDGSSLINANFSIGSIFGLWSQEPDPGEPIGTHMVGACYALYGPRVTLVLAVKEKGVHEFELNEVGEFVLSRSHIQLEETSDYFSPGNLRATSGNEQYLSLVQQWIAERRTLRYSGGMVPDFNHILAKKGGIFTYPADGKYPEGKLRLLFECAPLSFIAEQAGGAGLNQTGQRILDTPLTDYHQRTPILVGSTADVQQAVEALG